MNNTYFANLIYKKGICIKGTRKVFEVILTEFSSYESRWNFQATLSTHYHVKIKYGMTLLDWLMKLSQKYTSYRILHTIFMEYNSWKLFCGVDDKLRLGLTIRSDNGPNFNNVGKLNCDGNFITKEMILKDYNDYNKYEGRMVLNTNKF